jgi:uncharacterized protein YbaA (DUF1428 family)
MNTESYIDGFLLSVPRDNLDAYRAVAQQCSEVWKEHGALSYVETVLDDAHCMGMRSFPEAAGTADDEVVIFSWVEYPSKEVRDEANAKIMADPRVTELGEKTGNLFDCQRMSFGGFKPIVIA